MKNEQEIYFKEDSCVEINPKTKNVKQKKDESAKFNSGPAPEIFY